MTVLSNNARTLIASALDYYVGVVVENDPENLADIETAANEVRTALFSVVKPTPLGGSTDDIFRVEQIELGQLEKVIKYFLPLADVEVDGHRQVIVYTNLVAEGAEDNSLVREATAADFNITPRSA